MKTSLEHVATEIMYLGTQEKLQQHNQLLHAVGQAIMEIDRRLEALEAISRATAKKAGITVSDVDGSLPQSGPKIEDQRGRLRVLQEAERILRANA